MVIDEKVIFSGDTRFDISLFTDLDVLNQKYKTIFHDCQLFNPGTVHATYDELKLLPNEIKNKMSLVHYGDTFENFVPINDGFLEFTQPWKLYRF